MPRAEVGEMANEEHLRILKQGVDAWNQWRKDHPKDGALTEMPLPLKRNATLHTRVWKITLILVVWKYLLAASDIEGCRIGTLNIMRC